MVPYATTTTSRPTTRAALYARVSTTEQTPENQLSTLRAYADARAWTSKEFVDHDVSDAEDRRPALDAMLAATRAQKVHVIVITRLDRLARSTHHLLVLANELKARGVDLVVLEPAIDTTTPAGRLVFHVLAAIAEFERDRIRDRVAAGIRRAKAQGARCGRPRKYDVDRGVVADLRAQGFSLSEIGRRLGKGQPIHATIIRRALQASQ